ncbi:MULTISPECIES: bifunctional acetyl-CoA hydrolase/transferase family protein/GNAT family N-acetyltransferase [Planktothricoides]|uniref:GNAT family N-acetyltransferase n=2 Tax=Planktothricoides raciborskii TaxID=132608 RepID=A0AAU8JHN4_9CYAN|nr:MULTISPECIES: bifunctional acetyl-CoA hydrolase/transferase family protein/GNAT family N-acetyltransferase [Planktothricoides]KOR36980.1 acetyl-CoA hydrolase [Planktothricoides sp. SR001]MBD2545314.1 GNAT family N-acetyltransferase [Planktothricoides raciborskii FACHB-1370]MBD2584380.1 GNAT family N-acetyltransferase [Planktothricoides raciborskii FACHB-1261]
MNSPETYLNEIKQKYAEKFASKEKIFSHIHRGDHIFIGTGCGCPQYLVNALTNYVSSHPKELVDTEVLHVWTLDLAPYADEKYQRNFRHNSFFLGKNTRNAVNKGLADYTPVFLSKVPELFERGLVPIDVSLIQTSLPDRHGYMSLGISVDIVKAATETASLVIVQINSLMPRVHGDGFIHIDEVDFIIHHDEPILEYGVEADADGEMTSRIGKYVSSLIQDGDTIQVGYGSIPNQIMAHLDDKKDLGVHTELISDGLVDLLKKGVITNAKKTINPGKTIASFCMGKKSSYDYINDNPAIQFRTVNYTNNPLVIAQHHNMTAINSALEIDLTGQATAESLGKIFYSGIGGQADFMRGAILAPNGKTILTLESTAENGTISRIVPFLKEGAGITLNRGDVHYVVTEYGIAYLHGKNIRERAMKLIAIAHPKFRPWLIEQAKALNLIYKDQAFIAGTPGEYPENLETYRTTETGLEVFLRPVKISDEPLLKEFFYSLSDRSLSRRFMSMRKDMPHKMLQDLAVINFTNEMVILAILSDQQKEEIIGIGQYAIDPEAHSAEVALVIQDEYQHQGLGTELLKYLTYLAKKQGLLGFTAEVLLENRPMLHLFEKMGFDVTRRMSEGVYQLKMGFREG